MIKHSIDFEKSRELYNRYKENIKMKECYENVLFIVNKNLSDFVNNKYKVAYGYITLYDNLLCRHCVIINEFGNAIDPTYYAKPNSTNTKSEFFSIRIFNDICDYLDALEKDNLLPSLPSFLKNEEILAKKWAKKNNYTLVN